VVNVQEEVLFVGGPGNYLLLIIDNNSKIKIEVKDFSKDPLDYKLSGDLFDQNEKIRDFEQDFRSIWNTDINADLALNNRRRVNEELAERITSEFCESNPYPLVSILALQHIDIETDYRNYPDFYLTFLQKIKLSKENTSPYVKAFEKKLEFIEFKNHPKKEHKAFTINAQFIIVLFLIILGLFLIILFYLKRNNNKKQTELKDKSSDFNVELANQLTKREKEIMALLIREYQNKEIATELYLEVSTIKSHLSKIYQKLNVSNRYEAVEKFKSL
jgi:DNA-binding CsgD family transcriptional regulator